ncbi:MAG: hypothetical protein SFU53_16350 [Terrimicrobiaceae bacterium]|nr:hypothetical protein [Terrimicrobiaceae bacterium]
MHRPERPRQAFSLIEIVLALAVIAFALVGIMGMFPVAMRSAQESQRETRATFIAQQIFSDLRSGSGTNRVLVATNAQPPGTSGLVTIGLNTNGSNYFIGFDANGQPVGPLAAAAFTDGTADVAISFAARVAVNTNTGLSNLSRVETTVETPAAAPSTNRSRYSFVTLMNY